MNTVQLRQSAHRLALHVAIDGPAGAGKSTVGRGVAAALTCAFLDTGLMYRAVTWLALKADIAPADGDALAALAACTQFEASTDSGTIVVNGTTLSSVLRGTVVDAVVSEVSAHGEVRAELVEKQRAFADRRCVVMVGRDIGTTVLPDAPVKLWVTASPEERARRRFRESLVGSGGETPESMVGRIRARDNLDATRDVSPLRKAVDALEIQTDNRSEHEVVQAAILSIGAVVADLVGKE